MGATMTYLQAKYLADTLTLKYQNTRHEEKEKARVFLVYKNAYPNNPTHAHHLVIEVIHVKDGTSYAVHHDWIDGSVGENTH